jgi:flagellar basal body-associated protein FliL
VTNGEKLSAVAAQMEQEEEHVLEMESFVVNLTTPDGSNSYVKTQISLVYSEKKKADMLSEKSNMIRDVIIKDFMEYSPDQLLATGGLDSVKEQLKSDINASLGEEVVTGIYFTDFLIQ